MRQRILVLEDDRNITSALEVRLKAAGYDVWVARNAMVALELASSHQPDLLLSTSVCPLASVAVLSIIWRKLACRIYR